MPEVTIQAVKRVVRVGARAVRIVKLATQVKKIIKIGVLGPQGIPGTGGGSANNHEQTVPVTTAGAQSIALDFAPTGNLEWFINGLKNKTSQFALVGSTLTIPATVGLEPGDEITLVYAI